MIELLSKIFSDRDYLLTKIEDEIHNCKSIFVSGNKQSNKSEYFLLIQPPSEHIDAFIDQLLEERLDWYVNKLQESDPAFKKNCTLILCVQSGELSSQEIQNFEEDPYVFKKNVLLYDSTQLENLYLEVGESELTDQYVSDLVFKDEGSVFETFKNNSIDEHSFYPLLMMILAKLPMITYHRTESSQLYSLESSIDEQLSKVEQKIKNICLESDISNMDDKTVEKMIIDWDFEK